MKHKMDYEKFVYMANLKHGKDRYDYSWFSYTYET